jgi:hypothetical protein
MSHANPKQYFADARRTLASSSNGSGIEWEELPSLAGSLTQRLVQRGSWRRDVAQRHGAADSGFTSSTQFGLPWDNTAPAPLEPAPVSQPFSETLEGLASREVNEPDVFQHFFGRSAETR